MKPVSFTEKYWLEADGIAEPNVMTMHGPAFTTDSLSDEGGLEFKQITIQGGMHGWPRATSPNAADRSVSATDEIWNFFSQHTLMHPATH